MPRKDRNEHQCETKRMFAADQIIAMKAEKLAELCRRLAPITYKKAKLKIERHSATTRHAQIGATAPTQKPDNAKKHSGIKNT